MSEYDYFYLLTMSHGVVVSSEEKSRINAYADCGRHSHDIAKNLGESYDIISKSLKNPTTCGIKNFTRRPRMLTQRGDSQIQRAASNSTSSIRNIKADISLHVCRASIRTSRKRSGKIVKDILGVEPRLTAVHRLNIKICHLSPTS